MDGNAPRRSRAHGWLVGLVAIGLVSAVAVASSGSIPEGTGGTRRPSEALVDTLVSLLLVVMAVGSVFALWFLAVMRRDDAAAVTGGRARRRGPLTSVASLLMGVALVLIALRVLRSDRGPTVGDGLIPGLGGVAGISDEQATRYEPRFQPWPVVVVVGLALAAGIALWVNGRARRRSLGREGPAEPALLLADVLDETLDDLRAEQDPRAAVIAAYARMERALAAAGMPRRDAEAPVEYTDRVLTAFVLTPSATRRLTSLFAWARFSGHDVRPEMKDDAIEILELVRDELRAADVARRAAEEERRTAAAGAHP